MTEPTESVNINVAASSQFGAEEEEKVSDSLRLQHNHDLDVD